MRKSLKKLLQNKENSLAKNHREVTQYSAGSLFKEAQAAEFLDVACRTLQAWRYRGIGPAHIRLSRRAVRYRYEDLCDYVTDCKQNNTI